MSNTTARAALLAVCAAAGIAHGTTVWAAAEPAHPAALDDAIIAAAKRHGVPEGLVRRVIMRESKYNPAARNHKYWGLMQISYPTARSMGFKGSPQELLNPVVNLRYAVPYLANAFICSGKRDYAAAVRLYAAGYYFTARTRGLLKSMRTAESEPLNGVVDEVPAQPILAANASAQQPESVGVFGAIFSPGRDPQPQAAAYTADASATAGQPRPAPVESTAVSPGIFKGPTVAMEVGKNGDVAPPKKWKRDGGVTTIARGEQAAERAAAQEAETGRKSSRHSRKFTLVASMDASPSTAQAYAAPGQDQRFAATASQAAIAQATSGQAGEAPRADALGQPAGPQSEAAGQPATLAALPVVQPTVAEEDKPQKHRRSRHGHRHKAKGETKVAESKSEAAPELRSTATQ